MAMEKGLYAAPMGIEEEQEPMIEIEIADGPEISMNADGSVDIVLEEESETVEGGFDENLADSLEDGELQSLASELVELVDQDINSRKD